MALQQITATDIKGGFSNTTLDITQTGTGSIAIPSGNTAQRPSNPNIGYLRFNTETGVLENYTTTGWLKVSVQQPTISSISGNIYNGNTSILTITGTNFGASSATVNFAGANNSSVTGITPTSGGTIITVSVPAPIYTITAGSIVNITITNSDSSTSSLYSVSVLGLPTGGTITTSGNTRIHTYTSSGTFTIPSGFPTVNTEVLLVAGGGAGGGDVGGGGGAGGVIRQYINGSTGSYTLTVGAGGSSAVGPWGHTPNDSGSNTTGFSLTAIGGGAGGGWPGFAGSPGGSGGGSTSNLTGGGTGTPGQGYPGGSAAGNTPNANDYSGASGGGGAGGVGGNGTASGWSAGSTTYGYGGIGLSDTQLNGILSAASIGQVTGPGLRYIAGGGAAGSDSGTYYGVGGYGGGKPGGQSFTNMSGTVNTGGGAGGAGAQSTGSPSGNANQGGYGGSGVVVVRYNLP